MIRIIDKSKCSGCHACMVACPKQCIKMLSDNEGFLYPFVDENVCVDCGACDKVCPYHNVVSEKKQNPKAYAAISKDECVLLNSSSGGVFSLLAKKIISDGGVVFGAIFDENFNVKHHYVTNIEDLGKLRGSKYVQSEIGTTYKDAENYLKDGKSVLFTGTPCQILGLKSYLNKEYENLITQDIICHGVPSPMVWGKYVKYRSALAGASARRIFSRHKKYGWKRYSASFTFENDAEYLCQFDCDPFMRSFLKNLCLRPSCYYCNSNGDKRVSDITLADFWGIENVDAQMYNVNGTSLVVVNTDKGEKLLKEIQKDLIIKEESLSDAVKFNPCYSKSVVMPKEREGFMKSIVDCGFVEAYNKYAKESTKTKIKNILRRIKRKLFR